MTVSFWTETSECLLRKLSELKCTISVTASFRTEMDYIRDGIFPE